MKISCPLCMENKGRTVLTITEPDRFEKEAGVSSEGYLRHWIECSCCGLLLNVSNRKDISHIYEAAYYSKELENESVPERFDRILALPAEASDNYFRVTRVYAYLSEFQQTYHAIISSRKPKKVLDIGSGTGIFLWRFLERAADWEAVAVEPNEAACKHLRNLKKFAVIQDYFPSKKIAGAFDLVTLNKVLEHVSKPIEFLQSVHHCLGDSGIVYVEVPDKSTALHRETSDNILGSLHYYLFDPKTLCLVLEKAGFVPLEVKRYVEPSGKITVCAFGVRRAFFDLMCRKK